MTPNVHSPRFAIHGAAGLPHVHLLADPQHQHMSEQELVRALQSDRDGGQEERY